MTETSEARARKRVLSGIQPTGEVHLGNYLGALRQWVHMQDEYECFYAIVDQHAILGDGDPADLPSRTVDMAISVLSVGVDPERCTLFVQSDVPEHIELAWLFNTVAPVGDLERMTQYKDKSQRYDSIPVGLLNYPVLQAADILVYRADAVPVGEDQRQHLELTRDIARKWNALYGEYFPEPEYGGHSGGRGGRVGPGQDGRHRPAACPAGRSRSSRGVQRVYTP
jgi:tryptophanyl-tRNA synthetase